MNTASVHAPTKSGWPRLFIVAAMLVPGIGVCAAAQSNDPQTEVAAPAHMASQSADGRPATKQLIKPGDRTCLQHTGRLVPPKKGDCLPVPGRSYSGEELRNTGAIDNAHSLQMLDPSISRGH